MHLSFSIGLLVTMIIQYELKKISSHYFRFKAYCIIYFFVLINSAASFKYAHMSANSRVLSISLIIKTKILCGY